MSSRLLASLKAGRRMRERAVRGCCSARATSWAHEPVALVADQTPASPAPSVASGSGRLSVASPAKGHANTGAAGPSRALTKRSPRAAACAELDRASTRILSVVGGRRHVVCFFFFARACARRNGNLMRCDAAQSQGLYAWGNWPPHLSAPQPMGLPLPDGSTRGFSGLSRGQRSHVRAAAQTMLRATCRPGMASAWCSLVQ